MDNETLNSFIALLKAEKDVCVTFTAPNNNPSTYRYQLNERGYIFEIYTYNRTLYCVCHIGDERSMSDNFLASMSYVVKIEPTSDKQKKKFQGIFISN